MARYDESGYGMDGYAGRGYSYGAGPYGPAAPRGGEWGYAAGEGPGMRGPGGGYENSGPPARVRAADIMTDYPECVTPDTPVADVARRMRDLDVGVIPVVDDMRTRRLRGVVTDRDLALRILAEGRDGAATVGECMTSPVESVHRNGSVKEVMDVMRRQQVRRVPVVDSERRLVGIVSQADLAVGYAGLDQVREMEVEEVLERISEPSVTRRTRLARVR